MSTFNPGTYQSGDGNLNEPILVGRLGQPLKLGGGSEFGNFATYGSLDPLDQNGRPTAENFGKGVCYILTPYYKIFCESNGVSWTNTPSEEIDYKLDILGSNTPIVLSQETRAVPPGLPVLPMSLIGSINSWPIALPNDAINAFKEYHSALYNQTKLYVKPSSGSDANTGLTKALPFATVTQALRVATNAASHIVMLEDCVIPTFDLRASDPSQTTEQIKILDGNGFNVVIRDSGPDLTTQTWVVDGVNTNCYKTTLTYTGSESLTRVLRTDRLDSEGEPTQLKSYTSAALLNAAFSGYYYDSTGKVLWVNLGGANVHQMRDVLKGLHNPAVAGGSRLFVYGAKLGLSGIRTEGVSISTNDNATYPTRRPEIWTHNCKIMWSSNKGANLTNAGWLIGSDTLYYSSAGDNANAFSPSATGKGLILSLRCRFSKAADYDIFAVNGTYQGTSAHGGSDHVSWGSIYEYSNGSGIADTGIDNSHDVSWFIGCLLKPQLANNTIPNMSFSGLNTNSSRKVYLDSCISYTSLGDDLLIGNNAIIYTYNTELPKVTGGSAIPYIPSNPV
jgi:hypothetical protein